MKNAVAELKNRINSIENGIHNLRHQIKELSYYGRAKNTKKKKVTRTKDMENRPRRPKMQNEELQEVVPNRPRRSQNVERERTLS